MSTAPSGSGRTASRPLSPHLQIYRMPINMVASILHRITGAALYFGTLLLAAWLVALASGPEAFAAVSAVLGSLPGKIVLFGYTWALFNHLLGGVRHLVWDTIHGFELAAADALCWGTLLGSLALTLLLWATAVPLPLG